MIPVPALLTALCLPTLAAVFYFIIAAGHWSAALIYGGTKVAMVLGPLFFWWRSSWPPAPVRQLSYKRTITEGFLIGVVMATAIVVMALGPLAWLLQESAGNIQEKITEFSLNSIQTYVIATLFISCFHSGFEEWYWRRFAVGALLQRMRPWQAHALGGIAFAGHHIIVVGVYAGPMAGVLLGLVVGGAGVIWSLLWQRHGRLLGAWIAHALCDVAIMGLGWHVVQHLAASPA